MAEIERLLPATKVSEWLASTITGDSDIPPPTGNAGYFAGGNGGADPWTTDSIDRLDFGDETIFTLSATLSRGLNQASGVSNSGVAGYVWGGKHNESGWTFNTTIEKLTYSADTVSTITATLSEDERAQVNPSSFSNVGTAGYLAGGYDSGSNRLDSISKLIYSSEAESTISAVMSRARYETAAFSNSGSAGYMAGGYGTAYGSNQGLMQLINKLTYSNENPSTLSATLTMIYNNSFGKYGAMGFADTGTAGYVAGGWAGIEDVEIIDKITFSNDSKSTLSATMHDGRRHGAGIEDKNVAGYIGGDTGSMTAIEKIDFSNDTISTLTATISITRERNSGLFNGGTY